MALVRLVTAYRGLSSENPLGTAFVTCFVKGSASDCVVQHYEGGPFDLRRNVAFASFSGVYLGVGQHYIYNVLFSRLFGSGRDVATAAKKVVADAVVHVPAVYLPLYYPFETVATGRGTVRDGLDRYAEDAPRVLTTYWCTWPPAHFLSFSVLPQELRISFVAGLSFVWLCYLSNVSHHHPVVTSSESNLTTTTTTSDTPAAAAAADLGCCSNI
mmetsp:Transcript_5213/g.17085  ORF Transcript_5213/g.17085 Transcript_5213/m.17085 type:complete len:214 (+) Transcript_5213:79-720(+)